MTIDALPSKYGLPSQEPRKTPMAATSRPSSAAESSNRMATRLGSFERRSPSRSPARRGLHELAGRDDQGSALDEGGRAENQVVPAKRSP